METIRKQLPYSGPEEIKELRRIASKFEERIFGCATNCNSMKALCLEC